MGWTLDQTERQGEDAHSWCPPKLWPPCAGYFRIGWALDAAFLLVRGVFGCLDLHLHGLLHVKLFELSCCLDEAGRTTPSVEYDLVIPCMGSLVDFEGNAIPPCQRCLDQFFGV